MRTPWDKRFQKTFNARQNAHTHARRAAVATRQFSALKEGCFRFSILFQHYYKDAFVCNSI
jgi:hypothetical protein